MKYFLDTEFSERGPKYPLVPISIAIVNENGDKLYCVSAEFRDDDCNEWVQTNVLPSLKGEPRYSLKAIAKEVRSFVNSDRPEFWGYFADYDWVVIAQLFGTMMDLPNGWPMYCRDLKQWADMLQCEDRPPQQNEHNALADARWNMELYRMLEAKAKP